MGICSSTTEKRTHHNKNSSNIAVDQIPEDQSPIRLSTKPTERYLIDGNTKKIRELIEKREINVNSYDYEGSIMTILHKAVQVSEDPELIDLILSKGANVDLEEKETGNTPLMIASIDYKDEIVKVLLKYSPDLEKQNKKGQNIFSYLKYFFNDKQGIKQTDLSHDQKYKVDRIVRMLNEYKKNKNVEYLDHEDNFNFKKKKTNLDQDDSGFQNHRY